MAAVAYGFLVNIKASARLVLVKTSVSCWPMSLINPEFCSIMDAAEFSYALALDAEPLGLLSILDILM